MFKVGDKVKVNKCGPLHYYNKIGVIKQDLTDKFNDRWIVNFDKHKHLDFLFFTHELNIMEEEVETKPKFKVGDRIKAKTANVVAKIDFLYNNNKGAVVTYETSEFKTGQGAVALEYWDHYVDKPKPKFKIGEIVYQGYNYYKIEKILYNKEHGYAYICGVKFIGKDYTYTQSHKFYEDGLTLCKNDKIDETIIISGDKFSLYKGD